MHDINQIYQPAIHTDRITNNPAKEFPSMNSNIATTSNHPYGSSNSIENYTLDPDPNSNISSTNTSELVALSSTGFEGQNIQFQLNTPLQLSLGSCPNIDATPVTDTETDNSRFKVG